MQIPELTIYEKIKRLRGSWEGAVVLDIGGRPTDLTRQILSDGAEAVFAINIDKAPPVELPGYQHFVADARNLPASLPMADVVIGVNVMEHLPDLGQIFAGVFRKMKSKSHFMMHGGAFWPGPAGHHAYLIIDGTPYFFNHPGKDPFPSWGHLYMNEPELESYIVENKGIPPDHARQLVDFIYHTPRNNRLAPSEIISLFFASPIFPLGTERQYWGYLDNPTLDRIQERGHGYPVEDYRTGSLWITGMRW